MLTQLTQGLGTAATSVGAFLPKLLGFIVVLAIGWIVAKIIEVAVRGVLHRTGFNRLVERGTMRRAMERSKYDASELVGRIVYYFALLFVFEFAFGVFGPNPVSTVLTAIIAYLPRVIAAGVIVVIGAAIAAFAREVTDAALGRLSYSTVAGNVAAGAVLYITAFAALDELAVASSIVIGLFYASLAAIAGTIIVAAGGGGIPVARAWWQRASDRVESEAPMIAQETQGASERVKARAGERQQQAQQAGGQMREQMQPPSGDGDREHQPAGSSSGSTRNAPPRERR